MFVSDKYKYKVEPEFYFNTDLISNPGVYILATGDGGRVLKIGESNNLYSRLGVQYRSIMNSTNDFIRESIINDYKEIQFYTCVTPKQTVWHGTYKLYMTYQKELEDEMLREYKFNMHRLPALNRMIR